MRKFKLQEEYEKAKEEAKRKLALQRTLEMDQAEAAGEIREVAEVDDE